MSCHFFWNRRRPELFFKNAPVHGPSQTEKRIAWIELAFQIGEQKGNLGFVGGAGVHGCGLQGFSRYGLRLPYRVKTETNKPDGSADEFQRSILFSVSVIGRTSSRSMTFPLPVMEVA